MLPLESELVLLAEPSHHALAVTVAGVGVVAYVVAAVVAAAATSSLVPLVCVFCIAFVVVGPMMIAELWWSMFLQYQSDS